MEDKEKYLDLTGEKPRKVLVGKPQKPKKPIIPLSEEPVDISGRIEEIKDVENIEISRKQGIKSLPTNNYVQSKEQLKSIDPKRLKEARKKWENDPMVKASGLTTIKKSTKTIAIILIIILFATIVLGIVWSNINLSKIADKTFSFNTTINNNIPENPININNPVSNNYTNIFENVINIDLSGEILDAIIEEINRRFNITNSS